MKDIRDIKVLTCPKCHKEKTEILDKVFILTVDMCNDCTLETKVLRVEDDGCQEIWLQAIDAYGTEGVFCAYSDCDTCKGKGFIFLDPFNSGRTPYASQCHACYAKQLAYIKQKRGW